MYNLQILQQVYNNSITNEANIYEKGDRKKIKIPLFAHQNAIIDKMIEFEKNYLNGYKIDSSILYSKYGILGDSAGTGKTLMALGHIASLTDRGVRKLLKMNESNSENFYSLEYTDISNVSVGNLIIVSHILFIQWEDEIKNKTQLNLFSIKTKKDIQSDTFISNCRDNDIILISNTLYRELVNKSIEVNIHWNRIYIDEADSIIITSLIELSTNFYWFISSSFSHLLYPSLSNIRMNKVAFETYKEHNIIHSDLNEYINCSYISSINAIIIYCYLRSNLIARLLNKRHKYRGHLVLRCSNEFIKSSVSYPSLISSIIRCAYPSNYKINTITPHIQLLLKNKEFSRIYEQLQIKSEKSSTLLLQNTTDTFKEHIESTVCPICYDDILQPLLTSCCTQVFCATCILTSLSKNSACPLCRIQMSPNTLTNILKNEKTETENMIVANNKELKSKFDAFNDILKESPSGKFLLIGHVNTPNIKIIKKCSENNRVIRSLSGSKNAVASTLKCFKQGSIDCIWGNYQTINGLNITEATHIIFFESLPYDIESQLLGRAYNIERKNDLLFIKLLHLEEED